MNSPLVLHEVAQNTPVKFDPDVFCENIAQRCANILHSCHQHKLEMDYTIGAVLTGITLVETVGLKTFQTHIQKRLAKLAGRELDQVVVNVSRIQRATDNGYGQGSSSCEEYLRITATIK